MNDDGNPYSPPILDDEARRTSHHNELEREFLYGLFAGIALTIAASALFDFLLVIP